MPQWLTNIGSPDLHGPWLIIVASVAAILIMFLLYRFVFGHRLRVPAGGRTRQPRLGLVDAYSLDGQRQLVLVRRDNVEHLIMIGGPTDVLVESQIIRVTASPTAPSTRERESVAPVKAPPAAPPAPVASPAGPPSAPPPAERPVMPAAVTAAPPPPVSRPALEGPQVRILNPTPTIQAEPASAPRRPEPAPNPREMTPAPKPKEIARALQRPAAPAGKDVGVNASAVVDSGPAAMKAPPLKPAPAPVPTPARVPQSARPLLPPPIGTLAVSARPSPPAATREARAALPARPQSAVMIAAPLPPARTANGPDAFADLESLEAEMARLLGRDP